MNTAPSRRRRCRALWIALLSTVVASCATTEPLQGDPALFDFLQDGVTTRDAVMLRLGQPSATFQDERILTYRIGEIADKGYFVEVPSATQQWQHVRYSLVLVFGADDKLQKHSLVSVQ